MRAFSHTSSFNNFDSPSLDRSTKRFTKLKQNLDISNIRASNYKSALERTYERALHVEDYNFYGSFYQDFSSPSFSPKFSTSSSFFSSNSSSSYSKKLPTRYDSNSSIKPYSKKVTTTPSSLFNKKWDSNIDKSNDYSYQSYNYYDNYEDSIRQTTIKSESMNNKQINPPLNTKNDAHTIPKENHIQKKDKEIIFTPNRIKTSKKQFIQDNQNQNNEFGLNLSNQSTSDAINDSIYDEKHTKNHNLNDTMNKAIEEENEIDQKSKNGGFIEKEKINKNKTSNSSIDISKEEHSLAYLNAMNSVNSKMKQFNFEVNSNSNINKNSDNINNNTNNANNNTNNINNNTNNINNNTNKKSREDMKEEEESFDSNKSENDEIVNATSQKEEEDEFKKKQRVEIEEIKSLYALLEKELKEIQKETNSTNSNSDFDNYIDEENISTNQFNSKENDE